MTKRVFSNDNVDVKLVDLEEFACRTADAFDACFTKKNSREFSSFLIRYYSFTFKSVSACDNAHEALLVFHDTLRAQIAAYRQFIGLPLRFIPRFRPLYFEVFCIFRLRMRFLPVDIVWMILERMGWAVVPVTETCIRQATKTCIQQASYFKRFYIEHMEERTGILSLWDDPLVDALMGAK